MNSFSKIPDAGDQGKDAPDGKPTDGGHASPTPSQAQLPALEGESPTQQVGEVKTLKQILLKYSYSKISKISLSKPLFKPYPSLTELKQYLFQQYLATYQKGQ